MGKFVALCHPEEDIENFAASGAAAEFFTPVSKHGSTRQKFIKEMSEGSFTPSEARLPSSAKRKTCSS